MTSTPPKQQLSSSKQHHSHQPPSNRFFFLPQRRRSSFPLPEAQRRKGHDGTTFSSTFTLLPTDWTWDEQQTRSPANDDPTIGERGKEGLTNCPFNDNVCGCCCRFGWTDNRSMIDVVCVCVWCLLRMPMMMISPSSSSLCRCCRVVERRWCRHRKQRERRMGGGRSSRRSKNG